MYCPYDCYACKHSKRMMWMTIVDLRLSNFLRFLVYHPGSANMGSMVVMLLFIFRLLLLLLLYWMVEVVHVGCFIYIKCVNVIIFIFISIRIGIFFIVCFFVWFCIVLYRFFFQIEIVQRLEFWVKKKSQNITWRILRLWMDMLIFFIDLLMEHMMTNRWNAMTYIYYGADTDDLILILLIIRFYNFDLFLFSFSLSSNLWWIMIWLCQFNLNQLMIKLQ